MEFFEDGQQSTDKDHERINQALGIGGGGKPAATPPSSAQILAKIGANPPKSVAPPPVPSTAPSEAPQVIGSALQKYESLIWASGDVLYASGVKLSEAPSYMMPFFALMLVESRILRLRQEKIREIEESGSAFDPNDPLHTDWLVQTMANTGFGSHPSLARTGRGLKDVCLVPGGNFFNRLMDYLNDFDPVTKELLGIDATDEHARFLALRGYAAKLNKLPNSPLYKFVQKWAELDLTTFDNSEVTTLEEHIKRRWADMSADSAGQQYTPTDIIELASQIVIEARRRNPKARDICDVYDFACGGGNFLFAAENALREAFPTLSVRTRGQELNDCLYALSSIEARFRANSQIAFGNTLTDDHFLTDKFSVVVANPPYGQPWGDFEAKLNTDASGRFSKERMPSVSDSQMLFLQHAAFHLDEDGVGAIVHSGSSLFSGDAGSGESETRRWLLQEQDLVEAIIQLPANEFFNTGISTYLWVLNRAKPEARRNKVLLIDASQRFTKLKKNLNKKNCEIDPENRAAILAILDRFSGDGARVVSVDELLYNKVSIEITRKSESGAGVPAKKKIDAAGCSVLAGGETFDLDETGTLVSDQPAKDAVAAMKSLLKDCETISVVSSEGLVRAGWESESSEVIENGVPAGKGVLTVTPKVAKSKAGERVRVEVEIAPLVEKDTETIPFSSVPTENAKLIDDFLTKWVREPWTKSETKVGCEINFNRLFPKKTVVRSTEEILRDLAAVDAEIKALEAEFAAGLGGGAK